MNPAPLIDNTALILLLAFSVSVLGLFVFIWSMSNGFFNTKQSGSHIIFEKNEIGLVEDPAANQTDNELQEAAGETDASLSAKELADRQIADDSSALPAFVCLLAGMCWLIIGSAAAIIASIKLHQPDWLVDSAWMTFGRLRTIHLNSVIYGWSSMAGIGVSLWLIPRLLKTPLRGAKFVYVGAFIWHTALMCGVAAIGFGYTDGMEWLEMPWQIDIFIVIGGALMGVPLFLTLAKRNVDHLYVSVWYIGAALIWFPILFFVANIPGLHFGVQGAAMNWWYGHNALGLWFTPIGLGAAYYFIPKVLGRPVYSYNLSLLGFWCLAFFYSQVGGHHLIGGPLPTWMVTLSIVQSMMMIIPVIAVAVNHHMTVGGNFKAVLHSPTLRFIVLGSMLYVAASVQGSLEALRSVNLITHFTHYTVAHAHLGMYGFFTMVMFGSIYFIMPRIVGWEWPHAWMISAHFWLVSIGFAIYFIGLTIGGWLQGEILVDATKPFMDSVAVTIPYLKSRSVGGGLMVLGHAIFMVHFILISLRFGRKKDAPVQLIPKVNIPFIKDAKVASKELKRG
ncbi:MULTISPECIES: cbb3-type cytochrome c oxidase subunit I [Methylotenera]|uniref:cbb3-type cytochrome c oxidase subunit I n=1 Tax=Methylotenera TaxID=359407 RepID=UPI0003687144|nr:MULTISPECIES: cbb3-type cytochrome c oxidase subunit I [Methylotenera]